MIEEGPGNLLAPSGASPAASMPNATRRPRLTPPRAMLLVAVGRYLDRAQHPRGPPPDRLR
jgi:hypothetical protein